MECGDGGCRGMACANADQPGRLSTAQPTPVQLLAGDGRTPIEGCDVRVRVWVKWEFEDPVTKKRHPNPLGRSFLGIETYRDERRVAFVPVWCDEVPGLIPPYQRGRAAVG